MDQPITHDEAVRKAHSAMAAQVNAGALATHLATRSALTSGVVQPPADPAAEVAQTFHDPDLPINAMAKPPQQDAEEVRSSIGAINWLREKTPAFVVNNGARYNFGVRLIADILTFMSGQRKGSESPMRSMAAIVSGTALAMGLYYNESPRSKEDEAAISKMPITEYIPLQFKRALDPKHHVTATVGVATVANGLLYMAAGYAQHVPGKMQWEMLKGALTVGAGAALSFIPDQETAWQTSTMLFWVRAPSSYINAHQAYFKGIPEKNVAAGDWMQFAKWGFNQSSNVFGMLYGGIKKDEQGRLIKASHNEFREQTPDIAYPSPEEKAEAAERINRGDKTDAQLEADQGLPKNDIIASELSAERLRSIPAAGMAQAG